MGIQSCDIGAILSNLDFFHWDSIFQVPRSGYGCIIKPTRVIVAGVYWSYVWMLADYKLNIYVHFVTYQYTRTIVPSPYYYNCPNDINNDISVFEEKSN